MKNEPDYFVAADSPGFFQLTEKARALIALALTQKADEDDARAKVHAFSSGIYREQARVLRMIADVIGRHMTIAHLQIDPAEEK